MIPYGLLSQIALIIVAVAMTITYIKPTFTQIAATQDKIVTYKNEIQKVSEVNIKLSELVSRLESVSVTDHTRLLTYMPNSVDNISVPRDIKAIADEAGVNVTAITYEGSLKANIGEVTDAGIPVVTDDGEAEPHSFVLKFTGSYEQIKQILASFEQNHYPLEVSELEIKKVEGGFLDVTAKIITYDSVTPPVEVPPAL